MGDVISVEKLAEVVGVDVVPASVGVISRRPVPLDAHAAGVTGTTVFLAVVRRLGGRVQYPVEGAGLFLDVPSYCAPKWIDRADSKGGRR